MKGNIGRRALLVRRLSVIAILLAAYAYHRTIAGLLPLATIGMVSFCAVANFAPALVLGLYWRRMHRYGVIAGLAGGFFVWFCRRPVADHGARRGAAGAAGRRPAGLVRSDAARLRGRAWRSISRCWSASRC